MRLYLTVFMLTMAFQVVLGQNMNTSKEKTQIELTEISIVGTVADAEYKPLKGVTIFVDSVKTKVKTNRKGEFSIRVQPNTKVISAFSKFGGMLSHTYSGETVINFVFPKDYKIISKKELTALGYTTKTSKKQSKNYNKYLDVYQLLVAEFPGVTVNGKTIRLRGTASNSINLSQDPLLLVNGVQAESIDFIRPQDIKSIRVIRNEEASFYGARGSNGVIVIQMKGSG